MVLKTRLKNKKIKAIKNWLDLKLNSSKIVGPLTSMLKIANNLTKNLLISMYIAKKRELIDERISNRIINLFKPNAKILAKF